MILVQKQEDVLSQNCPRTGWASGRCSNMYISGQTYGQGWPRGLPADWMCISESKVLTITILELRSVSWDKHVLKSHYVLKYHTIVTNTNFCSLNKHTKANTAFKEYFCMVSVCYETSIYGKEISQFKFEEI